MASFTTRVVLHDADYQDYKNLHAEMAARGFVQTVTSDDGIVYELPDAEYNYVGVATRAQVLDKAKASATAVRKKYAVLVTESNGRSWTGLKIVSQARAA